jgi:3-methylcrotonyl-CoA carboxylase alpha subunit
MRREARLEGPDGEIVVGRADGGITIDGRRLALDAVEAGGELRGLRVEGRMIPVRAARSGDLIHVFCDGRTFQFRLVSSGARRRAAAAKFDADLLAPMPGRVRRLLVREGQSVARGETLLILEAMKMEHEIRSPRAGRIARLPVGEGALVDAGMPLVELE